MAPGSGYNGTIVQLSTLSTMVVSSLFPSKTVSSVAGVSGGVGTGFATIASTTTSTLTPQGPFPALSIPLGSAIGSGYLSTGIDQASSPMTTTATAATSQGSFPRLFVSQGSGIGPGLLGTGYSVPISETSFMTAPAPVTFASRSVSVGTGISQSGPETGVSIGAPSMTVSSITAHSNTAPSTSITAPSMTISSMTSSSTTAQDSFPTLSISNSIGVSGPGTGIDNTTSTTTIALPLQPTYSAESGSGFSSPGTVSSDFSPTTTSLSAFATLSVPKSLGGSGSFDTTTNQLDLNLSFRHDDRLT